MAPKKNRNKKNKQDQAQKDETTPTAGDVTPTMADSNENQYTENSENFTLNTEEESKAHEDQQPIDINDLPKDDSPKAATTEDTTQPQTEYNAPVTEPAEVPEATKEEEAPYIQADTKVPEETVTETVQPEPTHEEPVVEETKAEEVITHDEPKTFQEAISEESQHQGVAAEEQRGAGVVVTGSPINHAHETPADILNRIEKKPKEEGTVYVDDSSIKVVPEDANIHADANAPGGFTEKPKVDSVPGNEYKIEHNIQGLKETTLLAQTQPIETDSDVTNTEQEKVKVGGENEEERAKELPPAVVEPEVKTVDHPPIENTEEFPPLVVEPEVKIVDHPPQENKDVLTSSIKSEWEEIKPHSKNESSDQAVQDSGLGASQISERSQEPNLLQSHVLVEDKSATNVDLHGSLNQNWDMMVNKPAEDPTSKDKLYEQEEDIRSDKASDNAQGTRLMDDIEGHIHPSKGSQPQLAEISEQAETLPQEERLRKAEEEIASAKSLKAQNRPDEAIILLQSSRELLNPDLFSKEQTILNQVNQKIMECTLETADCYNQLNDFPQSIKYAKAIRKSHPENIRAIYLLGIGLVRVGELEAARAILKESKHYAAPAGDTLYSNLIDKELEKLDQIAESRTQLKRNSSHEDEPQPVLIHKSGSVDEKPVEEKPELSPEKKPKEVKPTSGSGASAAEYFLGSLVSSGALSFVVAKYLFKFPTKKGIIASLVIGAVVGGVSLITLRKSNKDKTSKK